MKNYTRCAALAKVAELERERDGWRIGNDCLERERDALKATLDKIAGIKGTPVVLALLKERDDLHAKLATVERHMALCRSAAGAPDDETLAVWIGELKAKCAELQDYLFHGSPLKAKCERLEKALREIREITLPSKVGGAGSGYSIALKCGQIANAALAGKEAE